MSTSVTSVVSHFPSAQNGFTTTLASTVASGATTVPLNSVAGYTNAQIAVFVVDPTDASKKQTFTGVIDTAGVQVTSVVWTAGTNQTHTGGSTVVDYATATHISMVTKGILVEHAQAGTHAAATITGRTEDTSPAAADSVLTYDTSATALKKVTLTNLFSINNVVPANALATTAITLDYTSKTTNFTTASATAVQVTGLSSTVTIPAGGRRIKITVEIPKIYGSTASSAGVSIWDGTVGSGTQLQEGTNTSSAASDSGCMTVMVTATPSAGSKTYNVGLATDAGTMTIEAAATRPAFILVEVV